MLQPLRDSNAIDVPTYCKLYPTFYPEFYGLLNIQKDSCPLRLTVSTCGSITYNSVKFVVDILSPLVGKTDRHLKNSADLVDKFSNIQVSDEECLVSYDITALLTSIPVDESVLVIHSSTKLLYQTVPSCLNKLQIY